VAPSLAVPPPKAVQEAGSGVPFNELKDLLRKLAVEAGKLREDANWTLRCILRGYRNIEHAKIYDLRQQRFRDRSHTELVEPSTYSRDFAILVVHITMLTKAGMAEEQAIELAKTASFDTLSRVEQRAVDKLTGAETEAATTYVERPATALAREVRKVWPTMAAQKQHRRRGRPIGWQPNASVPSSPEEEIRVPICAREAVSVVLPEIEKLVGHRISPSLRARHTDKPIASSRALEAVMLAVQLSRLQNSVSRSELETICREVALVHAKGGNRPT
jgi:hypothetical protein